MSVNEVEILLVNPLASINGTVLELVNSMLDLGVTVQSDHKWNEHVLNITARANSMLGFIKRTVGHSTSIDCRKALYVTLVRSVLEYCSPIWSPGSRMLTKLLEGVQRRATRFILGTGPEHPDYKSRLTSLGMLPLTFRREAADVLLFVKSLANLYDCDIVKHVSFSLRSIRTSRSNMMTPFRTKTQQFASSYIPRLICTWNRLDVNLRALGLSVSQPRHILSFKRQLLSHLHDRFRLSYSVDNPCTWISHCCCYSCMATRPR